MNINKIKQELEKAKKKQKEWERKVKELEKKYVETERLMVHEIVSEAELSLDELTTIIRKAKEGKMINDIGTEEELFNEKQNGEDDNLCDVGNDDLFNCGTSESR